jgi:non-specific serine/threonine protein kinase/serine/threonine-protein kinase
MSAEEHPERIGLFRILQVLGEGGMGIVYEAEQTQPVRRRVALKVMRLGMDTKEVVARFEAERQALAVMEHANIAKVFEAGVTQRGRPYFVMETVRGVPLNEYCDNRKLSTRERLELFVPVCQAVQHAHQKGVIHRDLKPSNVLVTEQEGTPVPKIIDFGIAKATGQRLTEKTVVTMHGQAMGTPAYMSPEQAEMSGLDVDTRTDIYSLGVMLYELLVGHLPIDPKELGLQAFIARLVLRETNPPTPSARLGGLGQTQGSVAASRRTDAGALRRELRGDLDWIVMKAMEQDRTRRYETANALAFELGRYLRDEPVLARPPSAAYRFGKFVRRHRAGVAAAALAALALLVGAVLATAGMVRATRAERATAREAEAARQVSDFLVGLFEVSDPGQARGNTITAREILDRGADKISTELTDQPRVQGRLMATMGEVYRALGLYDAAGELAERSLVIREEALSPEHEDVAASLDLLGSVYRFQGQYEEAEAALLRALAIREELYGTDDLRVVGTLEGLANTYTEQGKYDEAEPLMLRVVAIREEVMGPDDPVLARTLSNTGALYWRQGDVEQAEPYLRRALAIREDVLGPDDPDLADGYNNLGVLYWTLGRYDEAEESYGRAREIWSRALAPDHPYMAAIQNNLAETHWVQGEYAEAEALFLQALAIKEDILEPDHPSIAVSLNGLANVYRDMGRLAAAEPLYRRALRIRQRVLQADDPAIAETLADFARMLREAGREAEAGALERRPG